MKSGRNNMLLNLAIMSALRNPFGNTGRRDRDRPLSSWPRPDHIKEQLKADAVAKREMRKAKRIYWRNQMIAAGQQLTRRENRHDTN